MEVVDHKEGWALKNWCFQTVCWRRLLRVPWTARRSNQSILKKIDPEYSLKDWCWNWNSSTLATWCRRLTHWKIPLMLGKIAGGEGNDRGGDGWMASPTQWTWVWANSRRWWRTGKPGMLQSMGSQRVGHDWVTEQQQITQWIFVEWMNCRNRFISKLNFLFSSSFTLKLFTRHI